VFGPAFLYAHSEIAAMSLKSWLAGFFATVVLVASSAGSLMAQPGGGGRGQGGRGGFGGGMMMAPGGGGGVTGMLGLLRNEKVQGELKLSDEEKGALEKIGDKLREAMAPPAGQGGPGGGGFGNFRDMSEEDRNKMMQQMQERMKKANDLVREELESILPPDKMSRLLGIYIQNSGMQSVLTNPLVTDELSFTDEQKEKVTKTGTEVMEEMRAAMGELFGGGGGDRTAMQAKMEEIRKKTDEKYAGILTDEQKKKLEELKGAEFKLSPEEMRGGRGGMMFGGPGGRGPGGPGGEGGQGGRGGRTRGQRPGGEGGNGGDGGSDN
jgi:hypothetical protein